MGNELQNKEMIFPGNLGFVWVNGKRHPINTVTKTKDGVVTMTISCDLTKALPAPNPEMDADFEIIEQKKLGNG